MKKIMLGFFTLCAMLFIAACDQEIITDPGTLKIEDIEVFYQETSVIEPIFSEPLAGSQPTYTFEGSDIRIDGNVITGLVANTETEVTATTDDHETTFKVTVIYKLPLGEHAITGEGDDVFTLESEDVFVKSSREYGESFFYDGDDALHGIRYMLRGTLSISDITEGGQAQILIREFADKEVRFVFEADENEEGSYRVFSDYKNGEEYEGVNVFKTGLSNSINFNVMLYDGLAYLFISDTYVGNVSAADIGEAHIGFGGQGLTMTLSRLRADHNEGRMETYLAMAVSPFGNHAFTSAPSDPDVFIETEDNVYVKSLMGYQQTFYYEEGLPVAGSSFTFEGQVTMTDASDWGQFVLMITEDTTNMSRYVFERMPGGTYQIFFDVQDDGVFKNFEIVTTLTSNTLDFKVFFNEGNTYLVVDDVLLHSYEAGYEKTHIGLGGEKATITLNNIFGETNVDRLDDFIPSGYQLGEHFADANNDSEMFEKASLTSFEKTDTGYGQAFLSHNDKTLEGMAYTFRGKVEVSPDVIGATAIILFQQDESNFTRFVLEVVPEGVKIFTDNMINGDFSGWQEILAPQAENALDLIAVYKDGSAYLFLDDILLVTVETNFNTTQLGFAGEFGTMSVSNIDFVDNADVLVGISGISFGAHAYGAVSNNNVFVLQDDGSYKKTTAAYQQTFLYETLKAVTGKNFTLSGTLVNNGTANTAQAIILLQKDNLNLRRIVLERWDGKFQVFTDKKIDNDFSGWQSLRGLNDNNELNFELVYLEGVLTFSIDGVEVFTVDDQLGDVHLGFAGQIGEIILKDVEVTIG